MNRKQLEKLGATPGKLLLVAVLAVVLIVVVSRQLPKGNSPSLAVTANAPPATTRFETKQTATVKLTSLSSNSRTTAEEKKNDDAHAATNKWPEVNYDQLLTNDPFQIPAWAKPQETNEAGPDNTALAELQKKGVSIVMIGGDSKSATIGDQKLHVGDIISGYRITDITANGVLLDQLDAR